MLIKWLTTISKKKAHVCSSRTNTTETIKRKYLSWPNSPYKENSSQLKGAEDFSIVAKDELTVDIHPPLLRLDDCSQLTRGSPICTNIGNICNLTNKFGLVPPFFDISMLKSLTSTVALGVCSVPRSNCKKKTKQNKTKQKKTRKKNH